MVYLSADTFRQFFYGIECCRGKTNFFERRVGEYQKSGVMAGLKGGMNAHEFTTDADF